MKILIVSQYFWPEEFRINDICMGLKEKGHEVEVLTGLPNYPEGKIYDGYSFFNKGPKEYNGIKIYRVPMIARGKGSSIKLALNYISFMIMGIFKATALLGNRYDVVFVFQVSPITSAIPALFLSKIKKINSYIYIQDLWPETLYSIVNISNEKVKKILKYLCNKIYNGFDKLLIASKGYEDILVGEGLNKDKFEYFPQWAEDFYTNLDESVELKEKNFNITFAGNIGKAQSVETIIKAANLSKDNKDIIWNIIGDGSEIKNIKNMIIEYGLEDTLILHGRKPASEMPKYFSKADALIVTLRDEEILRVTLPAKVQSYMAAGKPILASISGEGKKVIEESGCGFAAEAEDYEGLYKNALKLYEMKIEDRKKLGELARIYFNNNFSREKLLNQLDLYIKN